MNLYQPINDDHIIFISVSWFNKCGIVLLFDTITSEYKSYISGENIYTSSTEDQDIRKISNHGSSFPIEVAKVLFSHVDFTEDVCKVNPQYFI